MTYGEVKAYLAQYTDVMELTDRGSAHVAVCPAWQGRVMTSTSGGPDGPSFGFVNQDFINKGLPDPKFNNYGGEERMWLSPEGGQYGLWFDKGLPQTIEHWTMPKVFNEGGWEVTAADDRSIRMTVAMHVKNASNTALHVDLDREIRLLGAEEVGRLLGAVPGNLPMVAYETINTITNRGEAMTLDRGLVSVWILNMLNSTPRTVVIVPFQPGPESEHGPVVKSDYFGTTPPERLKILPDAVLFLADANYRAKIGVSKRRACNVLGSIDFQSGSLTLIHFNLPDAPDEHHYLQNMFGCLHAEPYAGDVINSYNDGPSEFGESGLGPFYELETLSPAKPLATGQSLTHRNRTIHFQGEWSALETVARHTLGVDLEVVRKEMFGQ